MAGKQLRAPKGFSIPPLLEEFAAWHEKQPARSVGLFGVKIAVPHWGLEEADKRLQKDCFVFIQTTDGSQVVLMNRNNKPQAICWLGSEGECGTISGSLEGFLQVLADGDTGVMDLDDPDAEGRDRLKAWLKTNKVKAPVTDDFDFVAYLDGGSGEPAAATPARTPKRSAVPESIRTLPPILAQVAMAVGRTPADPETAELVEMTMGKKLPGTMAKMGRKYVVDKKAGVELMFEPEIINEKYPLMARTKSSFVPYLTIAWLTEKLGDILPFGLKFGMTEKELGKVLGAPTGERGFEPASPYWQRTLDAEREVVLDVEEGRYTIKIAEVSDIRPSRGPDERALTGVIVAWAATRGFLDETKLAPHAALIEAIRKKVKQGSALFDAAMPRGLWNIHIKDLPGLRTFLREWILNMGGKWIQKDLEKAIGATTVADDDWATTSKIMPVFDKTFARWVKK